MIYREYMCAERSDAKHYNLPWCLRNNRINTEWVYMYARRVETGSVPYSYRVCIGDRGSVDNCLACLDATQQWLRSALKKMLIPGMNSLTNWWPVELVQLTTTGTST